MDGVSREEQGPNDVPELSELDSCFETSMTGTFNPMKNNRFPSDPFITKTSKWKLVKYKEDDVATPFKNHSTTLYKDCLYVFGGYDGKKNHNMVRVFNINLKKWTTLELDNPPSGRNGHTATLIDDQIFIIGGWLGSGPFAADDLHVLDLQNKRWLK